MPSLSVSLDLFGIGLGCAFMLWASRDFLSGRTYFRSDTIHTRAKSPANFWTNIAFMAAIGLTIFTLSLQRLIAA